MSLATVAAPGVPTLDADPFVPDVLENPLPFQKAIRDAGPVVYLDRYQTYAVGRFDAVRAVLTDWQSFESGGGLGLTNLHTSSTWRTPSLLTEADPPRHDAPRRILSAILSPRALRSMRQRWVDAAEDLVDELLAGPTEFDAVTEIAQRYPLRVFPDEIGLPREGRENLAPYADLVFNNYGPRNALLEAQLPREPELTRWINTHCDRATLNPGGIGAAIWAAADRNEIAPLQAPTIIRTVLTAGVDTTVNGLASLLYGLSLHPESWQRLRAQPETVRTAFDEAVRWQSPIQVFFRTTTQDTHIDGRVIPAGQKVAVYYGSANNDPRRWGPDADEFSLDRDPSGHVGFGMGIHQCIGQHVARLEAESIMQALLARIKTFEINGPVRRHINNTMRVLSSLPVRVTAA